MKKLLFVLGVIGVISLTQATEVRYADVFNPGGLNYLATIKNVDTNGVVEISAIPDGVDVRYVYKYIQTHPELASEFDNRLEELTKGPYHDIQNKYYDVLPKYTAKEISYRFKDYPDVISYMVSVRTIDLFKCPVSMLAKYPKLCGYDNYVKMLSAESSKVIRHYLRDNGKSFVTRKLEDGTEVNPMKEPLDEFSAAINAPRFNGLNEWFEKYGSNIRVDMSYLPSDEEFNQLKTEILYGDKNLSSNQTILKYVLGVEGYNAFIKEYNEGRE